jgi:hypothetical protein
MAFFKKLSDLFTDRTVGDKAITWIYVRCGRCGEKIKSRVNLAHDLSVNFGDKEADTTYFTRKVLIGEERCYQLIEVELTYNHRHQLIDRQIKGGEFITEAEFLEDS